MEFYGTGGFYKHTSNVLYVPLSISNACLIHINSLNNKQEIFWTQKQGDFFPLGKAFTSARKNDIFGGLGLLAIIKIYKFIFFFLIK